MNAEATEPDIPLYRIVNWDDHFENNRTREMKAMAWVPVPNKHDGEGFRRIMREPDGIMIYGCWHLILQVASKCLRERGTLLRDDGTPITADTLSLKTGWNTVADFERALSFLSHPQVGWLEVVRTICLQIPHPPAVIPHPPARNRTEEKGREEKENPPPNPPKGGMRKRSLTASEKKRIKVKSNSDLMNRIGKWFGRQPTTLWTVYEQEALSQCLPIDASDISLLETYYTAEIEKDDYRRHDIGTLLNNLSTELDRARAFNPRKASGKSTTMTDAAKERHVRFCAWCRKVTAATGNEERWNVICNADNDIIANVLAWAEKTLGFEGP